MAASGRVVTIKDVVEQTGGMILPSQINQVNSTLTGVISTGWTTGLTVENVGSSYSPISWPQGYFRVVPAYAATNSTGVLSGLLSDGLPSNSYQAIPWSAEVGSYVYSVFPKSKGIRLRVYEDVGAAVANFEYFYLKYNGTARASKTWSSINKSWTGTLMTSLYKTDTDKALQMAFGGMNTSRRIYYSDNVVSPGAWSYIGKFNGVNATPGIDFVYKEFIASGVTRCFSANGLTYNDLMTCSEYLYRLNDISIAIAYSSAPSYSLASTSSYKPTWVYPSICVYTCSCDCDICSCDSDTCMYTA